MRNQYFLFTQENERLRFFHFQSHVLFVYLNSCEEPSRPVAYSCACIASSCLGYTRLTLCTALTGKDESISLTWLLKAPESLEQVLSAE